MKQRGFTLIELMVVIVMILTLGLIVIGAVNGSTHGNTVSWGVNGMTEMRCIDGYKFVVGDRGQARQVMDEFGKGVKCYSNPEPGKPGSFGQFQ
jgi:prepilin-type N-terminal cleavage/methylation domain-containing protein